MDVRQPEQSWLPDRRCCLWLSPSFGAARCQPHVISAALGVRPGASGRVRVWSRSCHPVGSGLGAGGVGGRARVIGESSVAAGISACSVRMGITRTPAVKASDSSRRIQSAGSSIRRPPAASVAVSQHGPITASRTRAERTRSSSSSSKSAPAGMDPRPGTHALATEAADQFGVEQCRVAVTVHASVVDEHDTSHKHPQ